MSGIASFMQRQVAARADADGEDATFDELEVLDFGNALLVLFHPQPVRLLGAEIEFLLRLSGTETDRGNGDGSRYQQPCPICKCHAPSPFHL